MKHLKEYNKYLSDQKTIYRVWDENNNVIIEFNESGNVYLASAYSDSGKEILDSMGINPAQHEIEDEAIEDILSQIKDIYPQFTVEKW